MTRLVDGAADTIDLETSANTTITTVSIVDEEIVTIDAADGTQTYTNFTTTDMTSLVVTGDNAVDVGTSSGTSVATVDASAMTAAFTGVFSAAIVAMTVSAPAAFAGTITTGSGADTVTGSSGNDNITTNNGADVITMGTGNDTVDAGGANDTIIGSTTGTNGITGGNGSDTMTGGSVVDTYVQTTTSSTAPSSISMAGATVAVGDSMTFANGVDIITNFSTTVGAAGATDDIINLVSTGVPTTLIGKTVTDVGGTDSYFGSGAWDANAKTFTFSADGIGADMFVADVTNGTNDGVAAFTGGIVLIGVDSDNAVAGQFT
jgi:Ca2+-binding RTX toxin-like protein